MLPFATSEDVESAWRPLTDAEIVVVDFYLEFISAIIRSKVSGIDDRITAGTLDGALANGVAVTAVVRYLRNPEGKRQEAIEDYSYQRDTTVSSGLLYLTDGEIALLSPRRGRAFSIVPSQRAVDTVALERVALLQREWRYWPVVGDGSGPRDY